MGMSDEGLSRPRPLAADHDTDNFDCGSPELNGWLKDWALENHRSGNCRVFVVAKDRRVVGYYALTSASVERELAPPDIKKGGVPRALPCILLARLAVDLTWSMLRIRRPGTSTFIWRSSFPRRRIR